MHSPLDWPELLRHPGREHLVQVWQDEGFLVDAVAQFAGGGVRLGEAAVVIARREHHRPFALALERHGVYPSPAVRIFDAEEMLARFMVDGMPQWPAFQRVCGAPVAELRLQYPNVRAFGEMVDVLWARGARPAAMRLEEWAGRSRASAVGIRTSSRPATMRASISR